MTNEVSTLRLQDAWRECERNIYHLCRALQSLSAILPMTAERFERLSDAQVQSLDQFILRFTKLQDAMGSRLFPAILGYLQEPYEERPMLDKLNKLEKLGYLDSAESRQPKEPNALGDAATEHQSGLVAQTRLRHAQPHYVCATAVTGSRSARRICSTSTSARTR